MDVIRQADRAKEEAQDDNTFIRVTTNRRQLRFFPLNSILSLKVSVSVDDATLFLHLA